MSKIEQIKVIVIGAGNRGQTYCRHMNNFNEGKGFKIVGVAEPDGKISSTDLNLPMLQSSPQWIECTMVPQ